MALLSSSPSNVYLSSKNISSEFVSSKVSPFGIDNGVLLKSAAICFDVFHERPPDVGYNAPSTTKYPKSLLCPGRIRASLASPPDRSFFTGDITLVPDNCIYHSSIFLKLVRFSYAYVLSLCLCDYFSRKLLAKFEFPYLKARYVLFFHRKEFRRKSNGVMVEFVNHFTALTFMFKYKLSCSLSCFLTSIIIVMKTHILWRKRFPSLDNMYSN